MLLAEQQHSVAAEESCFWLLCAMTDRLTPSYYDASLTGVRTDSLVLEGLLREHPSLSDVPSLLDERGVDMSILATPWLMVAFANALPPNQLLRVWDLFFCVGSRALLATSMAILALRSPMLRQTSSFEEAYPLLTQLRPMQRLLPNSSTLGPSGGDTFGGDGGGTAASEVLPTETLLATALAELRRMSPKRVDELRVEARRTEKLLMAPRELEALDAQRQRLLDALPGRPATAAVLASLGLDPQGCPDRWLEASFLRTAVGLSTATRLGELHVLSEDAAAAPIIGAYLRGLDLATIAGLDDEARRRLHRVRFRLKAAAVKDGALTKRRAM